MVVIYNAWEISSEERDNIKSTSTHLNLYYNSTKTLLDIYSTFGEDVKKCRKELLCILTNAARAIKLNACTLEVSRVHSSFKGNKLGLSAGKMKSLQDKLEFLGYIDIYRGGIIDWDNDLCCNTYLKLNDRLTNLFSSVSIHELLTAKEIILQDSVVIKDRQSKGLMSTKGVTGVQAIRSSVDALNLMLSYSTFEIANKQVATPQYVRSFSTNLSQGGRYYEKGSKIQNQSQETRKTLMIDNQETTELDFKALHPSLVYESEYAVNAQYIDGWIDTEWNGEYDPYPNYLDFLSVDQDKIEIIQKYKPKYNPIRNLSKYALMVSLNASSGMQAQKAIILEYNKEQKAIKDGTKDIKDSKYYGIISPKVFPGSKVMNAVLAYNDPISKYFYNDVGIKLQNVDSKIMQIVLDKIMALDMEVGLSMHDGIIVKSTIKDKVKKYMKEAYKEVMGSDRFCFVEEK